MSQRRECTHHKCCNSITSAVHAHGMINIAVDRPGLPVRANTNMTFRWAVHWSETHRHICMVLQLLSVSSGAAMSPVVQRKFNVISMVYGRSASTSWPA
jgi:hypothetical protein